MRANSSNVGFIPIGGKINLFLLCISLGKTQINLVFRSLIRTFETESRKYSRSEKLK